MKALAVFSIAALAAFAAAAETPRSADAAGANANTTSNSCFRTRDIQAHRFGDADTLYVRVNARDVYQLEMSGRCLAGHMSSDPLVIENTPPSGLVCKPVDLSLKIGDQGGHGIATPCIVRSMRKLTPQETAALPPKVRP